MQCYARPLQLARGNFPRNLLRISPRNFRSHFRSEEPRCGRDLAICGIAAVALKPHGAIPILINPRQHDAAMQDRERMQHVVPRINGIGWDVLYFLRWRIVAAYLPSDRRRGHRMHRRDGRSAALPKDEQSCPAACRRRCVGPSDAVQALVVALRKIGAQHRKAPEPTSLHTAGSLHLIGRFLSRRCRFSRPWRGSRSRQNARLP